MNQDRKNQLNRLKNYKEYISVMKKRDRAGENNPKSTAAGRRPMHVSGNQ